LAEHIVHLLGPRREHTRLMGDKTAAKRAAKELGIPVVPGSEGELGSDSQAERLAREVGYPLMLKAAAGGGGRGMRVVTEPAELAGALAAGRAAAETAFGDAPLYLEKTLQRPQQN